MTRQITRLVAALLMLMPLSATAEPIQLKLSFHASEQTETYRYAIKSFVDAVNAEGKGLLAIQVYSNGTLGGILAEQPRLVLDEIADIAFIVPGQTPYRFSNDELMQLPGLFRDAREGTLVYTRLIAANALHGHQDFFPIGAYTSGPTVIHSRKPIGSLAALKQQKIRGNNAVEAEVLERLGAMPTVMPAPKVANAIGTGVIDGAVLSPAGAFDFGISKVTTHHYLLRGGVVPLVVVMNRRKFEALPEAAKTIIRKFSGEWTAATWIESFGNAEKQKLDKLKSDPERKTIEPSPSDLVAAQRIYRTMLDAWATKSAQNSRLNTMVETQLTALRSRQ